MDEDLKEKLEFEITMFLIGRITPFTVKELTAALDAPYSAEWREALRAYLLARRLAFYNPETDKFLSHAGLFTNARFSIAPERLEIMQGILFVGHRCMPFIDPAVLPHKILFTFKGEPVKRKQVRFKTDDVYRYYYLYGEEYVAQFLAFENEENYKEYAKIDFEDPAEVSVNVLDLSQFYWKNSFEPGDRVIARVRDWADGIIDLDYLSAKDIDKKSQKDWYDSLERSFINSFNVIGPGSSIEEQTVFAYYIGSKTLLDGRFGSLEEFVPAVKNIEIVPYGVETRFWKTGEEIPADDPALPDGAMAPRSEIEEFFWDLGFYIPEFLIDAYVLDGLYCKEKNCQNVADRLLPKSLEVSQYVHKLILVHLNEKRESLEKNYNWFADQEIGPLRSRLIQLHSSVSAFIFNLEHTNIDVKTLPSQPFIIISQLLKHIGAAIENIQESSSLNPSDITSLETSVEGMEESFFETKTIIQDSLSKSGLNKFSVVRADSQADAQTLLLTDTANPNDTRVIAVPSRWNLELLKKCVLVSFDWNLDAQNAEDGESFFSYSQNQKKYLLRSKNADNYIRDADLTIASIAAKANRKKSVLFFHCDNGHAAAKTVKISVIGPYRGNADVPFCVDIGGSEKDVKSNVVRFLTAEEREKISQKKEIITDALRKL